MGFGYYWPVGLFIVGTFVIFTQQVLVELLELLMDRVNSQILRLLELG